MAETITYSDLRRGTKIELDGEAYEVVDFKHVVMQQRTPALTLKVRQLRTGKTFERNLPGNQRINLADVEYHQAQYLYTDSQQYLFMDTESFEQFPLDPAQLGNLTQYLREGDTIDLVYYKGEPVTLQLPNTVELKVVETPPAFKGDTAHTGRKPAQLETGLMVKVPMHLETGQVVRVDTRTGEYLSIVS
jgi:elongation factor P